jgi:hypothetical protein
MRFQREYQKFLVAFGNENLFVDAAAKGTFLGMSAYLKISGQPQLRFLPHHRHRKINKGRRAVYCEAEEDVDSGFKGLLHLSAASRL